MHSFWLVTTIAILAGNPVKDAEVILVPSTHLDLDFTRPPMESLELYDSFLEQFISAAQQKPEVRYTIEHVAPVRHFLQTHPEHREALKQLLVDGQLEISAAWTNPHFADLSGETIVRQVVFAKHFLRTELGYEAQIIKTGELADLTPQLPQVLSKCGVMALQSLKTVPGGESVFRYVGLDGSETLLIHTSYSSFRGSPQIRPELLERARRATDVAGTSLLFYSGPSWDDTVPDFLTLAEEVERWNQETERDTHVRIGTVGDYVAKVQTALHDEHAELPRRTGHTDHGECLYLHWGPTKYVDRAYVEDKLPMAEKLSTVLELMGLRDYPHENIDRAWELILSLSTHNWGNKDGETLIYPKWAQQARQLTDEVLQQGMKTLAAAVKSPESRLVVFNLLNWSRTDYVTATVPVKRDGYWAVVDGTGKETVAQIIEVRRDGQSTKSADADSVRVTFRSEVPSFGYNTYRLVPRKSAERENRLITGANYIENDFFRVEADREHGISQIVDKTYGRELVATGRNHFAGLMELLSKFEYPSLAPGELPPYDAENLPDGIDPTQAVPPQELPVTDVAVVEKGPARARLVVRHGEIEISVILYHDLPRLDVEISGGEGSIWCIFPMAFPEDAECQVSVPYASLPFWDGTFDNGPALSRRTEGVSSWMFYYNEPWHKFLTPERYPKGGKRAKATWFDLSDGEYGLTISQEGVYAPLFKSGNTFYQLLHLNGTHRFSLRSHAGDWREANAPRFGWERTTPLLVGMARQSESQDAGIPPSQSFLSLEQEHVVLSVFKPALDGQDYVLRCVETQDEDAEVKVRLSSDWGFTTTALATLMEETQEALTLTDGHFQFPIRGHELKTIYLARVK